VTIFYNLDLFEKRQNLNFVFSEAGDFAVKLDFFLLFRAIIVLIYQEIGLVVSKLLYIPIVLMGLRVSLMGTFYLILCFFLFATFLCLWNLGIIFPFFPSFSREEKISLSSAIAPVRGVRGALSGDFFAPLKLAIKYFMFIFTIRIVRLK